MAGFVGQRHVLGEKLDQMSSTQFTTGLKVWLGITYNIARDVCMDVWTIRERFSVCWVVRRSSRVACLFANKSACSKWSWAICEGGSVV